MFLVVVQHYDKPKFDDQYDNKDKECHGHHVGLLGIANIKVVISIDLAILWVGDFDSSIGQLSILATQLGVVKLKEHLVNYAP